MKTWVTMVVITLTSSLAAKDCKAIDEFVIYEALGAESDVDYAKEFSIMDARKQWEDAIKRHEREGSLASIESLRLTMLQIEDAYKRAERVDVGMMLNIRSWALDVYQYADKAMRNYKNVPTEQVRCDTLRRQLADSAAYMGI